jgi:hypothetical protein
MQGWTAYCAGLLNYRKQYLSLTGNDLFQRLLAHCTKHVITDDTTNVFATLGFFEMSTQDKLTIELQIQQIESIISQMKFLVGRLSRSVEDAESNLESLNHRLEVNQTLHRIHQHQCQAYHKVSHPLVSPSPLPDFSPPQDLPQEYFGQFDPKVSLTKQAAPTTG